MKIDKLFFSYALFFIILYTPFLTAQTFHSVLNIQDNATKYQEFGHDLVETAKGEIITVGVIRDYPMNSGQDGILFSVMDSNGTKKQSCIIQDLVTPASSMIDHLQLTEVLSNNIVTGYLLAYSYAVNGGRKDAYISRLGLDGAVIWTNNLTDDTFTSDELVHQMIQDNNGNYALTGTSWIDNGSYKAFTILVDVNGNTLYKRQYFLNHNGLIGQSTGMDIVAITGGEGVNTPYAITGSILGEEQFVYVALLSPTLTLVNTQYYALSTTSFIPSGIALIQNGDALLVGGEIEDPNLAQSSLFAVNISITDLSYTWAKEYNFDPTGEKINDLITTQNGFAFTGATELFSGTIIPEQNGQAYFMEIDGQGEVLTLQNYELGKLPYSNYRKIIPAQAFGYLMIGDTWLDPLAPDDNLLLSRVDEFGELDAGECSQDIEFTKTELSLELVVPSGFDAEFICGIVNTKKEWGKEPTECEVDTCCASTSCSASFTADINCLDVTFCLDQELGEGVEVIWDFGDGQTSEVLKPIYMYDCPDTFMVCATIMDGECVQETCREIIITDGFPPGNNSNQQFIRLVEFDGDTITNSSNAHLVNVLDTVGLNNPLVPIVLQTNFEVNPDSIFWRISIDLNQDKVINSEEIVYESGKVPSLQKIDTIDLIGELPSFGVAGDVIIEMASDSNYLGVCNNIPTDEVYSALKFSYRSGGGRMLAVTRKKKGTTIGPEKPCLICLPIDGNIEFGIENLDSNSICSIDIKKISIRDAGNVPIDLFDNGNFENSFRFKAIEAFDDNPGMVTKVINMGIFFPYKTPITQGEFILIRGTYTPPSNISLSGNTGAIEIIYDYMLCNGTIITGEVNKLDLFISNTLDCPKLQRMDDCGRPLLDICSIASTPETGVNINLNLLLNAEIIVFPNPANNSLFFNLDLKGKQPISMKLYDFTGKEVKEIVNDEILLEGFHQLEVNIHDLSDGLYFVSGQIGDVQFKKEVVIIK